MPAINLNGRDYYVTGTTRWDTGRIIEWDSYKAEPIVCPLVERYGPEVERDDPGNHRFRIANPSDYPDLPLVGYTITILTCVKLTAAQHEIENARNEQHASEQLAKLETEGL